MMGLTTTAQNNLSGLRAQREAVSSARETQRGAVSQTAVRLWERPIDPSQINV